MADPTTRALLAAAVLRVGATLAAQDPEPDLDPRPEPVALRAAVEAFLAEPDDAVAEERLGALLGRDDAEPAALLEIVRTPAFLGPGRHLVDVPHAGELWPVEVLVPAGHSADAAPLPTVLDIQAGNLFALADYGAVVRVSAPYSPEQFSEEGRDGFLKFVRTAAARANGGDLWLGGYSWAGHASWGTALHRPGFLRGIIPSGGGPRRHWFRVLENVADLRILQFCGEQDDPELVWNLREVDRIAADLGLDYTLRLDPQWGHNPQLAGIEAVPAQVLAAPARERARKGTLRVDGPFVENPWIRVLEVNESAVRLPTRIRVTARADPDDRRRAVLAAYRDQVATLRFEIERKGDRVELEVRPKGVERMALVLRADDLGDAERFAFRRGSKVVREGPAVVDRELLLREARRTGERRNPAVLGATVDR